jgi:taurine dioxygenase
LLSEGSTWSATSPPAAALAPARRLVQFQIDRKEPNMAQQIVDESTAAHRFIEEINDSLDPVRFEPLQVRQLMPTFGARISGVDLSAELDSQTRALLRDAWLTYGVVIFTDQRKLTSDQHLEVAKIFGTPDTGSPFVEKLTRNVDVITTDASRPPVTNLWHSDNTALANPSLGTLIQIQECPRIGGNTSWASATKAYRCLSAAMRQCIDGLSAVHYWDTRGRKQAHYLSTGLDLERYTEQVADHPPRSWPVVRVHPVTGAKAIYVNETYTTYIEGLHAYESRAILEFLYSWIRLPEFYATHSWAPNDIAVWDNFQVQHYGIADYSEFRVNQRVTFTDFFATGRQAVSA